MADFARATRCAIFSRASFNDGADGFAVDASLIAADANKQRSVPSKDWKPEEIKENAVRAVQGTSPLSMTRRSEPHRQ